MGLCYGHSEIFWDSDFGHVVKTTKKPHPIFYPNYLCGFVFVKKNVALKGMKKDRLENCARLARIPIILLTTYTFLRLNLKLHHSVNILFLQIDLEAST